MLRSATATRKEPFVSGTGSPTLRITLPGALARNSALSSPVTVSMAGSYVSSNWYPRSPPVMPDCDGMEDTTTSMENASPGPTVAQSSIGPSVVAALPAGLASIASKSIGGSGVDGGVATGVGVGVGVGVQTTHGVGVGVGVHPAQGVGVGVGVGPWGVGVGGMGQGVPIMVPESVQSAHPSKSDGTQLPSIDGLPHSRVTATDSPLSTQALGQVSVTWKSRSGQLGKPMISISGPPQPGGFESSEWNCR